MFEFLIGIFLFYLLYKTFIKPLFAPKQKKTQQRSSRRRPPPVYGAPMVVEEMKRCPTCGTFNPKSLALLDKEQYFCSIECRVRFNS